MNTNAHAHAHTHAETLQTIADQTVYARTPFANEMPINVPIRRDSYTTELRIELTECYVDSKPVSFLDAIAARRTHKPARVSIETWTVQTILVHANDSTNAQKHAHKFVRTNYFDQIAARCIGNARIYNNGVHVNLTACIVYLNDGREYHKEYVQYAPFNTDHDPIIAQMITNAGTFDNTRVSIWSISDRLEIVYYAHERRFGIWESER